MAARKKVTTIEIKGDSSKKARREARALLGVVPPSRPLEERQDKRKKPKHKKDILKQEEV